MEVEIKYTNVSGSVRNIKACSPDEAIDMLAAVPGYAMSGIDIAFKDAMAKAVGK